MTWLLAILALGLLVVIHEFGHFLVARWCGMRVETFSVGFGPQIPGCKWHWKGTEFVISWIPLGGYVKIGGSNPYDEDDYKPDDPTAYLNQSAWKRMAVVAAGPGINYLFALVVAVVLFSCRGVPVRPESHPLILAQVDRNQAASKAGLMVGDRILTVDGRKLANYLEFKDAMSMYLDGCRYVEDGNRSVGLEVIRAGQRRAFQVPVDPKKHKMGIELLTLASPGTLAHALIQIAQKVWVAKVVSESARGAGLLPGDIIETMDGHEVRSIVQIQSHVQRLGKGYRCPRHMERAVVLGLVRDSKKTSIKVFPDQRGLLGVVFKDATVWEKAPLGQRIYLGVSYPVRKSYEMLYALKVFLGKLIKGPSKASSHIAGPVGIVVAIKTQIRQGFFYAVTVIMFLSVMLGLFNILPIPALDGGHLVFRILEVITRHRLKPETEGRIHQVALLLLLAIFVLVTIKDCRRLFGF